VNSVVKPTGHRILHSYQGDPITEWEDMELHIEEVLLTAHTVAIDVETINVSDRSLVGLAIATSPWEAFYFPWDSPYIHYAWQVLYNPDVKKIFHNCMFDLDVLWNSNPDRTNIEDTAVLSRFDNHFPATLDAMSMWVDRIPPTPISQLMKDFKTKRMDDIPMILTGGKCILDAQITLHLWYWFLEHGLHDVSWEYYRREMAIIPLLLDMGRRGMMLDQSRVREYVTEYDRKMQYNRAICEGHNFSPGSPQQVGYALAMRGNWLPTTRKKRQLATGSDTLRKVDDPLVTNIIDYRHERKMLGTYLVPWSKEPGRATTRFNLDARTARISSANYNLTNVPHELRGAFVGDFIAVDASQLELREMQYLSGDQRMKDVFDRGQSIHVDTANALYGYREHWDKESKQYHSSKNTNFCIPYGGGIPRIADTAGVSFGEAARILSVWKTTYSQAWKWTKETGNAAVRGEKIETVGGRKMLIHWDEEGEEGVRKRGVNYPIQTSAGETLRKMITEMWHPAMVLQVHDELIYDQDLMPVKWTDQEIMDRCEWLGPVRTPVEVKRFRRWGD